MLCIRSFDYARDYAAAVELWQSAGPGVHVGPSDTPAEIQKKLTRDADLFLVAEYEGRLVGTVLGGFDGRRGMVYHLAVQADFRRQGVATRLMQELELRLKQKGCLKCYLLVVKDNLEGVDFYQSAGWEPMDLHIFGKVLT